MCKTLKRVLSRQRRRKSMEPMLTYRDGLGPTTFQFIKVCTRISYHCHIFCSGFSPWPCIRLIGNEHANDSGCRAFFEINTIPWFFTAELRYKQFERGEDHSDMSRGWRLGRYPQEIRTPFFGNLTDAAQNCDSKIIFSDFLCVAVRHCDKAHDQSSFTNKRRSNYVGNLRNDCAVRLD